MVALCFGMTGTEWILSDNCHHANFFLNVMWANPSWLGLISAHKTPPKLQLNEAGRPDKVRNWAKNHLKSAQDGLPA